MIPPVIGEETSSPGERMIFERFRTEPGMDGWTVFHSLDIPRHRKQLMGEIDFVVAVPGKGVLCLEVKSHQSVGRDSNGVWHLGQNPPNRIGPFRQVSDAMHSLRKYVANQSPGLRKVLFWSAVCFTNVPFRIDAPAEWHTWQVMDCNSLSNHSMADLVTTVLEHAHALVNLSPSAKWFLGAAGSPTAAEIERLIVVLRPSFEFYENPKSRSKLRDDELLRYTSEQYDALDAMNPDVNPRVLFEGPAGTGKTLLALEETRRRSLRGERVLLCCFNHLLGDWLKEECEPFAGSVVVSTFHGYLLQMAGISVPQDADTSFWEQRLPQMALDRAKSKEVTPFDVLIIDEAQDLTRDNYLDFLDLIVKDGFSSGRWRMFGDFERQAVYGSSCTPISKVIAERAPGTPRYSLTRNCRNTPRIASLVTLLAAFVNGYRRVLRPDNGIEPEILYYGSPLDQDAKLAGLLEELYRAGYSNPEIVILSARARDSAGLRLRNMQKHGDFKHATFRNSRDLRCYTVQSFKGLEAPVVIVTDIVSVGTKADQSVFYVAVTRAIERLYVLASSELKPSIVEILSRPKGDRNDGSYGGQR